MAIIPSKHDKRRIDFAQIAAPLQTFFLNTNAGSGNTSSGVFVDYPGPVDKIIVKRESATAIFVSGFVGAYKGTNAGNIYIALQINGVDWLIGRFFFNQVGVHMAINSNAPVAIGLVAGTYTVRIRWAVDNINANADNNDIIHLRFDEGYFE